MAGDEAGTQTLPRLPGEGISVYIARSQAHWTALRKKQREQPAKGNGANKANSEQVTGGRATDSLVVPVRDSRETSEHSSQETSETAEDLLQKFGKRTEPAKKSVVAAKNTNQKAAVRDSVAKPKGKPSADDFVGFGNESTSTDRKTPAAPADSTDSTAKRGKAKGPGGDNNLKANTTAAAAATAASGPTKTAGSTTVKRSHSMGEKKEGKDTNTIKKGVSKPPAAGVGGNGKDSVASSNAKGKRPATTDDTPQERKMSLQTLPKIQKKTSVASPQSPDRADTPNSGIIVDDEERPPRWYQAEQTTNTRKGADAEVSTLLERLTEAIRKGYVGTVRDILHKLPFMQVTKVLLKNNRMLHNEQGLSQLFKSNSSWPYDVRADAKGIYNKWCRQIFETDLLRGIQLAAKKPSSKKEVSDRNQDRIAPGYAGKVDFRAYGNNDLSNGQWFPTQLTTVRDGAHGATQGGISGKFGAGAYSCIMTGQSGYPDEDNGDVVLYCGTDSDDGTVTDRTQMMLDSIKNGRPVRFIRKSTLRSQWAPEVGYRYDGLYDVQSFEKLVVKDNPKAARHCFRLVRCPGQDPIRGTGPEKRPTEQEIERYQMDKRFR